MKNYLNLPLILILFLSVLACGSSDESPKEVVNTAKDTNTAAQKATPQNTPKPRKSAKIVDVPKLANKSTKKFDETFGEPVKITPIKGNPRFMPGEYREYKVEGHPKNLSVRFYKDKAKRFNLLLGTPEKSSKSALKEIFKINVTGMRPIKSDRLSDTWEGKSGRINYKTAYAKRNRARGDFVMLHAEIR